MPTRQEEEFVEPLFPSRALDETVRFYKALGFQAMEHTTTPYPYAELRRGKLWLYFTHLAMYAKSKAFGALMVIVPDVASYHQEFAEGLRTEYGRIPTAGVPRITRLSLDRARFHIFDPAGNMLLYVGRTQVEEAAWEPPGTGSDLAQALENAVFLRDIYANDQAAAGVLDRALKGASSPDPVERARALAVRAELAVAQGDVQAARAVRMELAQIELPQEARDRYRHELEAADVLERWLAGEGGSG